MSDIYETIDSMQTETPAAEPFDKDAWAAKKQEERQAVYTRLDDASLRVNSDLQARQGYLDVMAALPNMSAANTLLVFDQNPQATRVGDAKYWDGQRASIKRGEKGIAVLEPGREYEREDGSIGTYFEVKKVFDISQTTARPRLRRTPELHGVLRAMIVKSPVPVRAVDELDGRAFAYDHAGGQILVQRGLSEPQLFCALGQAMAHAHMAQGKQNYDSLANDGKAELATAVLARRFGVEDLSKNFPTPAPEGSEPREVRAELAEVASVSKDISEQVREALRPPREQDVGER